MFSTRGYLLFFLFFMASFFHPQISNAHEPGGVVVDESLKMTPAVPTQEFESMMMMMDEHRRKLVGFQICSLCTCCGGPKGLCLPSPCCYAISCNIPNRPFGFCAFIPRTCNCFGCHL